MAQPNFNPLCQYPYQKKKKKGFFKNSIMYFFSVSFTISLHLPLLGLQLSVA